MCIMTPDLARYHRQMLLPGFGEAGQRRLVESTALIVGCGALGTVAADMLARAGVGHLVIIDRDFIELTNLQRQVLFDEADVAAGLPKAEAAKRKIAAINSQVKVTAIIDDLNHTNVESLADSCDVMVDGVDNFETRFLLNDTAVKHAKPYLYAGAVGTVGMNCSILPHTAGGDSLWERAGIATPCLRCIFEQAPPPGMNPTCDTVGVLGPVVAMTATHSAAEALKVLSHNFAAVNRRMVHFDVWDNLMHAFDVASAYEMGDCVCCKHRNFEHLEGEHGSATTTLCGRNAVQISHKQAGEAKVDFKNVAQRLAAHGQVTTNKFLLRAQITDNDEPYELTLFTDGRAIVKGTKQPAVARSIYAKYVGG